MSRSELPTKPIRAMNPQEWLFFLLGYYAHMQGAKIEDLERELREKK